MGAVGHGAGMRWVLMLFVVFAAVMGGEARAVVVMGRAVVSERVGRAETVEERAEALRVQSDRAFLGAALEARKAAGLVDAGPLALWFPGGFAVARSDCGDRSAKYTVTAAGSAWTVPSAATVQHVRGPDLGGGTKGLLYSLRNGLPTFNRYNGRGDVVAQSDIDGTTTWAASYQADGRRTAEAGTNVERHRACTKEEDPTGLLNEGFRYRDMETGTFISRDPLGLVDGPNVYCYVRQNPWTMWDPEGLWAIADDAIAMGVGAVLGVAAQGVSDVWHGKLSGWEDYAASGVGGALAGEAALYTGGLASGAVYGASANLTRQGLRNLSGKQSGFDCNSLVAETAVCAVGGKLGEVAAPYLSRTVARAMQKESSVAAAGSTTALNAEVKATGDVLESTIAPAAEAGAAKTPATVMQHPGNPTHFSVAVEGGAHTHQVVTGAGGSSTRIVTTEVAEAGEVLRQATVGVDAAAAAARQAELLSIRNLGPYDELMNSCVSHVCDVLRAGGVAAPKADCSSAQIKFLLRMMKQSKGGGG